MKDANEYAIAHELRCVELRLQQIQSYLRKIELLVRGRSYEEVNKMIPPIKAQVDFHFKQYKKLKRQVEKVT